MISAQLLWGSVLLIEVHHKYAKTSYFKNVESALYLTSVSMPLIQALLVKMYDSGRCTYPQGPKKKLYLVSYISKALFQALFKSFEFLSRPII